MQLAELEFGQAEEASGHEIGVCVCVCVCVCARAHMGEDGLSFFFAFYFVLEYRRLTML